MMGMLTIFIILLATLENMWPLIAGYRYTPPGYVFLGTVHHPSDYFYYLSQFAQGGSRWITAGDLFTAERIPPSFVGWSNVLTGKLFSLFGLPPAVAYHTSVFVFTVVLLVLAYALANAILNNRTAATLTLYFFTLFHAFPIIQNATRSYADYWNNMAVPRVRFGGVPHQLLLSIASFGMAYCLTQWIQHNRHTKRVFTGLVISSIVLASLQPVLWTLMSGITLCTVVLTKQPIRIFLVAFVSGLIPILYLTRLFETLPFSQLKHWEAQTQNILTFVHFLAATGPVTLYALFSLPAFIARRTYGRLWMSLFPLASYLLFLSPVSARIGISNVRWSSTLTIFAVSLVAAYGTHALWMTRNTLLRIVAACVVAGTAILLLPNHGKTLELATAFEANNAYHYLTRADYDFLRAAGAVSRPDEVYLVAWPFDTVFPAVTGRTSYTGHPLLTIRSSEKNAESFSFFSGTMDPRAMRTMLQSSGISYVIAPAGTPFPSDITFLTLVKRTQTLILYHVP